MDAHDVSHRDGKHTVRIVVAQILLGREWEAGKVVQCVQIVRVNARLRVEFLAIGGDVLIGMGQRTFQSRQLQRGDLVATGGFDEA